MAATYQLNIPSVGVVDVLVRSNIRRMTLRVRGDKSVSVSSGPGYSPAEVYDFVEKSQKFIEEARAKLCDSTYAPLVLSPQNSLQTCLYTFRFVPDSPDDRVRGRIQPAEREAVVSYPASWAVDSPSLQEALRACVDKILLFEAKRSLPKRVGELCRQFGFKISSLDFRNMKSRWGSCSTSGRICLNTQLVRLPAHLIDMVILHELNHLRHMDHSAAFHAALNAMLGGREKELDRELKKYSPRY